MLGGGLNFFVLNTNLKTKTGVANTFSKVQKVLLPFLEL